MSFNNPYQSFSRFTDPRDFSFMLDTLPDDVIGICEVAKHQKSYKSWTCLPASYPKTLQ